MHMLSGGTVRGPTVPGGAVLVVSRLLLVSQAVSAALRGRGMNVEPVEWGAGVRRATHDLTESDLVVLFEDLEDLRSVLDTQALITDSPAQFLVLTPRPEGPAWGALLACGVADVMSTESSLVDVAAAVRLVREGGSHDASIRRSRLVDDWVRWLAEDDARRTRLAALSPREREVLGLLSQGRPAHDIAVSLSVSKGTVLTHIKSINRKLDVRSRLAAVAVVHRVGDVHDRERGLPRGRGRPARQHDGAIPP